MPTLSTLIVFPFKIPSLPARSYVDSMSAGRAVDGHSGGRGDLIGPLDVLESSGGRGDLIG